MTLKQYILDINRKLDQAKQHERAEDFLFTRRNTERAQSFPFIREKLGKEQ